MEELTSSQIRGRLQNYWKKVRRDENGEIIFDKRYDDYVRFSNKKWKSR